MNVESPMFFHIFFISSCIVRFIWSDLSDRIYVSSYDIGIYDYFILWNDFAYIEDGKKIPVTDDNKGEIGGKTLVPVEMYSVNIPYNEYVDVTAPDRAIPGETVTVEVLKNDDCIIRSVSVDGVDAEKVDDTHYSFTMPSKDVDVVIEVVDDEAVTEFRGTYLDLDSGKIGISFCYSFSKDALEKEGASISTWTAEDKSDTQTIDLKDIRPTMIDTGYGNKEQLYVVTRYVSAKEMTDEVTCHCEGLDLDDDVQLSVRDVAKEYLERYTATDLVKAMLNYGAYSQLYFGYNTNDLANSVGELMSEDDKDVSYIAENEYGYDFVGGIGGTDLEGKVRFVINFSFDADTTMALYFKGKGSYEIGDISTDAASILSDVTVDYGEYNGYKSIYIRGIKPEDLSETFHMTVNGVRFEYSPHNYLYNTIKNSENEDMRALAQATCMYMYAAMCY